MTRALRLLGATYYLVDGAATVVVEPDARTPSANPIPPSPGGTPPTYPDDMPEPGALTLDSGPAGEGTASGTLTVQPSLSLPMVLTLRVSRFESTLGYSESRARTRGSRGGFDCIWAALTDADKVTLKALFDAHLATARRTPFNWTPPGGSAGKWAIPQGGEPRYEQLRRAAAWRVTASLVECR